MNSAINELCHMHTFFLTCVLHSCALLWVWGGGGGGDINTQNANVLSAVGARAGAASEAAELRKHTAND